MRDRTIIHALLVLAAAGSPAGAAEEAPKPVDILEAMGFDESDRARVFRGRVVTGSLDETADSEMACAVALLLEARLEAVEAAIREQRLLRTAKQVEAVHALSADGDGGLPGTGEGTEIGKLREVEVGSTFNLAASEVRRLQQADDVNAAYRGTLQARLRAYLDQGLQGVAPYARDDGVVQPGRLLAAAARRSVLLVRAAAGFHGAYVAYPGEQPEGIEHDFFCIEREVEDRPTLILAHRMLRAGDASLVMAERQFYVGHSYDCGETIVLCLPLGPRTLMIQTSRTWSDQVTGLAGVVRKRVGRRMMRSAVVDQLEAFRDSLVSNSD